MECCETTLNFILSLARLRFPLDLCLSRLAQQHLKEKCGPCEGHCHKLSLFKACRCADNVQITRKGTAVAAEPLLRLLSKSTLESFQGSATSLPSSKQTQRLQKWIRAVGNGPSHTPDLLQVLPGSLCGASVLMDSLFSVAQVAAGPESLSGKGLDKAGRVFIRSALEYTNLCIRNKSMRLQVNES